MAKAAADSMAYELGVPSVEGIIRNSFIDQVNLGAANRVDLTRMKYTVLPEVVEGRRILLVEDAIVRSAALKTIVFLLRENRAKEIHVRIACPPIIAPCYYGLDLGTINEMFAPRFMRSTKPTSEELVQMALELGCDSLHYLPVESIARCIRLPQEYLCRACITGEYPTPKGQELFNLAFRMAQKGASHADEPRQSTESPTPKKFWDHPPRTYDAPKVE